LLLGAGALLARPAFGAVAVVRVDMVVAAGTIGVEVDAARAPLSAGGFLRYVDGRRYDGGVFSRVVRPGNDHGRVPISVVQGGARAGAALAGNIAHEDTRMTGLRHLDGTVSLPRDGVGSATGGEFFICIGDQPELDFGGRRNADGQGFAAFARVVSGMDLVRAIWRMDAGGASPDAYTAGQMLRRPVPILSVRRG
jgi:peptidyl-prolyl cis-trans isomerase A (cyclophilin A)